MNMERGEKTNSRIHWHWCVSFVETIFVKTLDLWGKWHRFWVGYPLYWILFIYFFKKNIILFNGMLFNVQNKIKWNDIGFMKIFYWNERNMTQWTYLKRLCLEDQCCKNNFFLFHHLYLLVVDKTTMVWQWIYTIPPSLLWL